VIPRAAAALLLAVALWIIVSGEESAATWVPVRVLLTLDSAVVLREPVPPVRAFVVGRRRDLFQLLQAPPVLQRAVTEDTPDSVRLELREQDLELPSGSDARVRDLKPRLLTVRLRLVHDSMPHPAPDTAQVRVGVRE
jgi:hypothetical protein